MSTPPDGEKAVAQHDEFAHEDLKAAANNIDLSNVDIRGAGRTLIHQTPLERRAQLKIDAVIIPFSVLLYTTAYLDRSNMGNARLQGFEADVLSGNDTHYSIALMCFYITYILGNVPGTILAKIYPANKVIGIGCFIWSVAATALAGAKSEAGAYVARLFIGVGESLFGISVALWVSYWYTKEQFSKRIGFYICGGSLAGAFGGLIAFGVQHITNSKIEQWRILFLIEGIPTIILSFVIFFFCPSRPQDTKLFTEEERVVVLANLQAESQNEGDTGIDWKGVKHAALDWRVYVITIGYFTMNCNLGSVGGFLPTIIKGLGYTNAQAQLYTVPPYVVALVYTIIITYISDRYQSRGIPLIFTFCIGVVGWSILLGVPAIHLTQSHLNARYFGCICVVITGYAEIPLLMAWQSGNNPAQSQRAYALGVMNSLGQCASIMASFIFPSNEGPQYRKGISVNLAFMCLAILMSACMTVYFRRVNRKRDEQEGGPPRRGQVIDVLNLYDNAPGFRYVY